MIGSNIENYKVVGLLGEGGMGTVYRAYDVKLERYVAIKILNAQATKSSMFIERFKREAKNQARLTHPNIVPVYGLSESNGTLGIIMEYVEGNTLERLIESKGRLQLLESLYILKQILAGISYAHKKGFIHRDIKPSNIIINSEGVVKIMDFGISKSINNIQSFTKTGVKIGTILYMSPEQIKAQEPTAQSDIYAIGITFFEMLAGKTPFNEGNEFQVMETHLKKNPPKLSATYDYIPSETDKIIHKALAKQASKRYISCEEFLVDVDNLISSIEQKNRKKKRDTSIIPQKQLKKERLRFFVFAFFFLAAMGVLVSYFYNTIREYWDKPFNETTEKSVVQQIKEERGIKFAPVKLVTGNSLMAIAFVNDTLVIACGSNGMILRSYDTGKIWNHFNDSTYGNLYSIFFISESRGFITGDSGLVLRTTNMGESWERKVTPYNNSLFSINFADINNGFIVGTHGLILKTTNGGNDWREIPYSTTENLFDIYINPGNKNLYIVGWNGQFLKSTDLGESWNIKTCIANKYLKSITFYDNKNGFAVGGGGVILRTKDSGVSWKKLNLNIYSALTKVCFRDSREGIILGTKGEVLYTKDSGDIWKIIPAGTYFPLTDVEFKKDNIFITGQNGLLLNNERK